jgi:hypothetical protein
VYGSGSEDFERRVKASQGKFLELLLRHEKPLKRSQPGVVNLK